jgi:putative DNA primase/helicase
MLKESTVGINLIPENIPEELTERPQWVVWRYEERNGTMTKVPHIPYTGLLASSTDLMDWRTFDEAVGAYRASVSESTRPYDGIGLVFSSGDPYVGIDLDDCRDPKSGKIAPWAKEIIDLIPEGYTEVSPSGRGIHIICRGTVRGGGMRKGPIEMYSRDRYFAITGHQL